MAATIAALVLASGSAPALAAPASAGATDQWMLIHRNAGVDFAKLHRVEAMRNVLAVPVAETPATDNTVVLVPRMTRAILLTTTSPLPFGADWIAT